MTANGREINESDGTCEINQEGKQYNNREEQKHRNEKEVRYTREHKRGDGY